MGVQFFGSFLIEQGVIDRYQLRQATEHMTWLNRTLGHMAVQLGYLTEESVKRVLRAQARCDAPFGELALELGVLSRVQRDELLARQSARQARLGDSLVELGHLEEGQMKELLERFESEQAPYTSHSRVLPEPLQRSPLPAGVLELAPRLALRIAGLPMKIGACQDWSPGSGHHSQASVTVGSPHDLEIGLASDAPFSQALACGKLDDDPENLEPDTIQQIFREFLLAIVQGSRASLEPGAAELQISAPRPDELPAAGFAYELVAVSGAGLLILEAS